MKMKPFTSDMESNSAIILAIILLIISIISYHIFGL